MDMDLAMRYNNSWEIFDIMYGIMPRMFICVWACIFVCSCFVCIL